MDLPQFAWNAPLAAYELAADRLLAAFRAADPDALTFVHRTHAACVDPEVRWRSREMSAAQIAALPFASAEAHECIARSRDYRDWAVLCEHVAAIAVPGSATQHFEAAVQATIDGDDDTLRDLLAADAGLARARSTRCTTFDPPVHGATLLHYVAANGVEGHNQRTPANAVAIAQRLLAHGADANATAGFHGGACTVLALLVSSCHPAQAGVQVALVDLLVAHGAQVDLRGSGRWSSPLRTALAFGYVEAARALVRHGASTEGIDVAAGFGDLAAVQRGLGVASAEERHRALALAAQLGHGAVVAALLDAGEDANRFNPEGLHPHATPLHHAAGAGCGEVVQLLLERGALSQQRDKLWRATPRGWAERGGHAGIAALLRILERPR